MAGSKRHGPNGRAVNDTVRDLRSAGHLSPQHGALVQLALSLAEAVDREPDNASLWREYRGAVTDLARLVPPADGGFEDLLRRLRTPVGDAAN